MTVTATPVELTAELPGRTAPLETSDVRPQVNGIIIGRPFTEGGNVRAGQVLYQIDPAPYRAALDQARALEANAEANLATARAKAERYADLVRINAVSRQDYDDAVAFAKQAAANVQQQKAAVEAAAINLGYTRVTAPISGRVGRSAFTKGALVTSGQASALTTIQRLDPIYVDMTQSAAEVLKLRQAMEAGRLKSGGPATAKVRLILEDGSAYPLEGRLEFTEVTVDQTTGSVALRAIFPNPQALLLPGLYVRAIVVEGADPAGILAPQAAVARDEKGRPTALVVDSTSHVQARVLTTPRTVGDQWLVTSGLAPGDRLIVEGLQAAKPGAQVRMVSAPANAAHPAAASAGAAAR
ncbi:MAG: efflux transporter periplasmic adaptor subunit [Caulobacteraceae bacterium]|nr:efflux transporter periplasmic adaptor subunit [Caulobacteraceae bacterium]